MFQILLYISLIKQLLMPQEDEYTYEEKLRREILFFLYKEGCWGTHHFPIAALRHRIRIDSELPSNNATKRQIKQLLREELISRYKQYKNIHLNSRKRNEIETKIQDLIDNHYNI
jgi:hypothetical protein